MSILWHSKCCIHEPIQEVGHQVDDGVHTFIVHGTHSMSALTALCWNLGEAERFWWFYLGWSCLHCRMALLSDLIGFWVRHIICIASNHDMMQSFIKWLQDCLVSTIRFLILIRLHLHHFHCKFYVYHCPLPFHIRGISNIVWYSIDVGFQIYNKISDNIICKAIACNDIIISSGICLGNIFIEITCYVPSGLLLTWFNFNPSMDSIYMPGKVWGEITYPFLNFNGCTVEV